MDKDHPIYLSDSSSSNSPPPPPPPKPSPPKRQMPALISLLRGSGKYIISESDGEISDSLEIIDDEPSSPSYIFTEEKVKKEKKKKQKKPKKQAKNTKIAKPKKVPPKSEPDPFIKVSDSDSEASLSDNLFFSPKINWIAPQEAKPVFDYDELENEIEEEPKELSQESYMDYKSMLPKWGSIIINSIEKGETTCSQPPNHNFYIQSLQPDVFKPANNLSRTILHETQNTLDTYLSPPIFNHISSPITNIEEDSPRKVIFDDNKEKPLFDLFDEFKTSPIWSMPNIHISNAEFLPNKEKPITREDEIEEIPLIMPNKDDTDEIPSIMYPQAHPQVSLKKPKRKVILEYFDTDDEIENSN